MNVVQHKYVMEAGKLHPFASKFLSSLVLDALQDLMTSQLRAAIGKPDVPRVELAVLHSVLVEFALGYRYTHPTPERVHACVVEFADQMQSPNETRYREIAVWNRRRQGIPHPSNMPMPLAPEGTDFTLETSDYMLSHPISYRNFPAC
jgi:hypothetical protein